MSEQKVHTHETTNAVKMAETIKDGKIPSNKAIDTELEATKDYLHHKEKHADTEGEAKTLKDARLLVEATQETIKEKNPDGQLQQFVKDVKKVSKKAANDPKLKGKMEDRKAETSELISSLRDLMEPLIKSSDFRKYLSDTAKLIIEIIHVKTAPEGESTHHAHHHHHHHGDVVHDTKVAGVTVKQEINLPEKTTKTTATLDASPSTKIGDLPEEQKKKIRELYRALLKELSSKSEATDAYRKFLNLMRHLHSDLFNQVERGKADSDVQNVTSQAKTIVEGFTGDKTLDDFLDALKKALRTIDNDHELNEYLRDLRLYIENAFDHPELVESKEYIDKGDQLIKRGYNFGYKYKNDPTLNHAIDEAILLLDEMRQDKTVNQLKLRARKFFENFTYEDKHGNRHIDLDVLGKMRSDIIPFLSERIKEVPIPKIEIENKDFEYLILDDIYLTIDEILPNMIHIHSQNDLEFNVNELKPDKTDSVVKFKIEGLKPKIKDFYFAFKRKKLIKLEDEGRADVAIKGDGLDIYIDFKVKLINGTPGLDSHTTKVNVHKLTVDITDAKHKFMLNFITSLFSGTIEKQVEKALEKKIDEYSYVWAEYVNKQIFAKLPSGSQIKKKIEEQVPALN